MVLGADVGDNRQGSLKAERFTTGTSDGNNDVPFRSPVSRPMFRQTLRPFGAWALTLLFSPVWAAEFDCLLEPRQTVEIRSPVEGVLESISVQRGDAVKKGQVLAILQSAAEKAALELARSRAEMDGRVRVAEARLNSAIRKEERARDLYNKNFISDSGLEEARSQRQLAESELREARQGQRLAELESRQAAELVALRTIRSPFAGVVVERFQDPGEFAAAGVKEPILKLAQVDPLNVEVILPAAYFGKVRVGLTAEVTPEAPSGTFLARVTVVDPVIDAASGTFRVRADLPNPRREIPAGAKCRVRFPE